MSSPQIDVIRTRVYLIMQKDPNFTSIYIEIARIIEPECYNNSPCIEHVNANCLY